MRSRRYNGVMRSRWQRRLTSASPIEPVVQATLSTADLMVLREDREDRLYRDTVDRLYARVAVTIAEAGRMPCTK